MSPDRYHFRGFPEYVDAAAGRVGRPDLAGPARRVEALAALSNLCSQAIEADPERVASILDRAAEIRDHLRIASEAADGMLSDVFGARDAGPPAGPPKRARSDRRSKAQGPGPIEAP
ncbi:hypothetical protein [Tautonia plasticadhaerens]|uniref:Uncharacterized protein n=1 Tax=Tautonia plasticadhaerens TaxID=2527974 RepID=A0A518HC96_9BACT|nr:hypothetical protein [Tautonia plasticadhaerens]QDV38276.1 hypothetical protein ElP_62270 [Tautonia plasticadhaerens]